MELKRVVVTGLGAITPVGNSVPEFWENIVNGVSGAGPITHFDASLFKTQFACEVKNFDATKYIDRKEARKMDLYTQYAIAVAKEAVADSGLDTEKEDLNKSVLFSAPVLVVYIHLKRKWATTILVRKWVRSLIRSSFQR